MLILFALGLMSKSMLVTLPFVMLLMDIWPLHRISLARLKGVSAERSKLSALIREKAPLFALALVASLVTYFAQKETGAVVAGETTSLSLRVANALVSYVVYIVKAIWPTQLALFYPYPTSLNFWSVAGSALVLIVVTALLLRTAIRRPFLIVGWLGYLGTLIPVIGIIQAGTQARADRFMYVPLVGLCIVAAWAVPQSTNMRRIFGAIGAGLVLAAAINARVQVGYWKDNITLWEHTLSVAEESFIAHINLGLALHQNAKLDEAIAHYRAAVRLRPNYAEAHNNLAVALVDQGKIDDAIEELLEAIKAKPRDEVYHLNVAVLLNQKGNRTAAVEHLETALKLNPGYADARRELDRQRGEKTRQ
jgi:tetratricopeptide (TPR) repeat protein